MSLDNELFLSLQLPMRVRGRASDWCVLTQRCSGFRGAPGDVKQDHGLETLTLGIMNRIGLIKYGDSKCKFHKQGQ